MTRKDILRKLYVTNPFDAISTFPFMLPKTKHVKLKSRYYDQPLLLAIIIFTPLARLLRAFLSIKGLYD